jgi:ABC-2 type transport system permease protein
MRLLLAEALKVRTTPRTLLGLVLGLIAVSALGAAAAASSGDGSPRDEETTRWDVLAIGTTATIFTLILGILIVTWEYRHGTITQTFLATPRRERVMASKFAVALVVGAILGVVCLVAVLVTAAFWISPDLTGGQWELVGRLILAAAIWGVLGAGLGALIQSQVGAIIGAFVWFLIAEPLIGVRFDRFADYLPGGVSNRLTSRGEPDAFGDIEDGWSFGIGAAALLAGFYALAAAALGTASAVRRDVN